MFVALGPSTYVLITSGHELALMLPVHMDMKSVFLQNVPAEQFKDVTLAVLLGLCFRNYGVPP
jgi:hypothetical protein